MPFICPFWAYPKEKTNKNKDNVTKNEDVDFIFVIPNLNLDKAKNLFLHIKMYFCLNLKMQ
jgi:hypothetical protein